MKTIAEIEVAEPHGIRRFLYPLCARIAGAPDPGKLRVAEQDGQLVPSQAARLEADALVEFAVSLAPGETRRLLVVETDETPAIPDPLRLRADAAGNVDAAQQRFAHRIDSAGQIASVTYDNVRHLSEPATIALDDVGAEGRLDGPATVGDGLGGVVRYCGQYDIAESKPTFTTTYHLTCCKSWIDVHHRVTNPPAGSRLTFTLPMAASAGTSTCDFGVGNGLYGKLQAGSVERIVWHTELGDKLKWWVGSCTLASPTVRIDGEGALAGRGALGESGWFHWIDRNKALAVALTKIDDSCERISIGLDADGTVKISFFANRRPVAAPVEYGVCWHFLNDIPPIAAATNPASILLPPVVRVMGK